MVRKSTVIQPDRVVPEEDEYESEEDSYSSNSEGKDLPDFQRKMQKGMRKKIIASKEQ